MHDRIATVRLDRPETGNALDIPMTRAFGDAIRDVENSDVGALIITGTGWLFCSGGDVRAMAAAPDRPAFLAELAALLHEALTRLRSLTVPIIAAVNGTAAGAGLALVLSSDIVIASRDARFLWAYGEIGLSPDGGVTALLPQIIGVRRAALVALTGQSLSATQALEWQLVTDVCDPSALDERAAEIAGHLAARAQPATGETARLLRASSSTRYVDQITDEAATITRMSTSPAATVAIGQYGPKPS